jgi:putative transcriptional regulator
MDAVSPLQEVLAKRIAGEIILSGDPGRTLRKWRELLAVTQTRLARKLAVSPSVVSDYENGRRMPGTHFIRRFVAALFAIDGEAGGHLLREFARLTILPSDALLDVREFPIAVAGRQIVEAVEGVPVACEALLARRIYGYTVLDSLQFIQTLSSSDASAVFGTTTERALIFTHVSTGRSPMVAVRVHPVKPRLVVLHGPDRVDALAVRLAEVEQIPLVLSRMGSVDGVVLALHKLYHSLVSGPPSR